VNGYDRSAIALFVVGVLALAAGLNGDRAMAGAVALVLGAGSTGCLYMAWLRSRKAKD